MSIKNVDYAIEITQSYGQMNNTLCNESPVGLLRSSSLHSTYPEVHKHYLRAEGRWFGNVTVPVGGAVGDLGRLASGREEG